MSNYFKSGLSLTSALLAVCLMYKYTTLKTQIPLNMTRIRKVLDIDFFLNLRLYKMNLASTQWLVWRSNHV